MTGDTIKEFLVGLGFDVDEGGARRFEGAVGQATKVAAGLTTVLVGAGAAVLAFADTISRELDKVSDLSSRTGVAADEIQRLEYVANLTDSSVEAVRSTVDRFSRTIGEAADGVGRGATAFKDYGLNARKANGEVKTTGELLEEVSGKLQGMERVRQIAMLEKLGIDSTLIQALTGGLAQLGGEFDAVYNALGINSAQAMQAASDYQDSLGRLRFVMDSVFKAVALQLLPQLDAGINRLRRGLIARLPEIVDAVTPVLDIIVRVAEAVVQLGARGMQAIGAVVRIFDRANDATDGWLGYLTALIAGWKLLNLTMLASPIGIVLGLAAAVALLVDDFLSWQEGGTSLVDWGSDFGAMLQVLIGGVTAFAAAIAAVRVATGLWAAAQTALNVVMAANPIGLVVLAIAGLVAAGITLMGGWQNVRDWFAEFFDWISGKFGGLGDIVGSVAGFLGFGGGAPALAPAAGGGGGGPQTVNAKTEIIVQASGDPSATGRAIAREQGRVNNDMARNMRGAVQ